MNAILLIEYKNTANPSRAFIQISYDIGSSYKYFICHQSEESLNHYIISLSMV